MSASPGDNFLQYKTANGLLLIPYKGDIVTVQAEGVVTRDDDVMEKESMVTKSLIYHYSDFKEKRTSLKKTTKFLFFFTKRFKLCSIQTTVLDDSSKPAKFVFHAIMKENSKGVEKWEGNMEKLFLNLLTEAEKREIKALAVPLLGAGMDNVKIAANVAIRCFSDHRPKHLQKVYLVSKGKYDIYEIIACCRRDLILVHGNQPPGEMIVTQSRDEHLPGFENFGVITITYNFPDGTQGDNHPNPGKTYKGTTRNAYLPDSTQGREVLSLLKSAFDRKLIFTIGRSFTTGQDNVVKWNVIPHKSQKEGDKRYSYPDPEYLTIVKNDLAKRGITKGYSYPDPEYLTIEKNDLAKRCITKGPICAKETQHDRRLEEAIQKKKLVVRDNDAKGDCMFQALSHQLDHVMGRKIGHMDLRKKLVKHLRENPTMPDGTSYDGFIENGSLESYLTKMSEEGEWGDHLMLITAANVYEVVIVVIHPDGHETTIKPHGVHLINRLDRIYLGLVSNRHYVSLEKCDSR